MPNDNKKRKKIETRALVDMIFLFAEIVDFHERIGIDLT